MIFNLTQPVLDSAPKFTYTGTYEYIDDGGGNWRIKFLTSGIFTPMKDMIIDAFLVGGGGGGGQTDSTYKLSSGGGGGYTTTQLNIALTAKTEYPIVIGTGGPPSTTTGIPGSGTSGASNGGNTTAFSQTASGGKEGRIRKSGRGAVADGGAGGSGGGNCEQYAQIKVYDGQSDGAGGTHSGEGQVTTTREFEESTGELYAGGGGAYVYNGAKGNGGAGGGANGGESAADNTGGGGGGNGYGGSGIVVIRKHKEAAA